MDRCFQRDRLVLNLQDVRNEMHIKRGSHLRRAGTSDQSKMMATAQHERPHRARQHADGSPRSRKKAAEKTKTAPIPILSLEETCKEAEESELASLATSAPMAKRIIAARLIAAQGSKTKSQLPSPTHPGHSAARAAPLCCLENYWQLLVCQTEWCFQRWLT